MEYLLTTRMLHASAVIRYSIYYATDPRLHNNEELFFDRKIVEGMLLGVGQVRVSVSAFLTINTKAARLSQTFDVKQLGAVQGPRSGSRREQAFISAAVGPATTVVHAPTCSEVPCPATGSLPRQQIEPRENTTTAVS